MIQFVFEITEQELRRIETIIIINHRVKPYTGVAAIGSYRLYMVVVAGPKLNVILTYNRARYMLHNNKSFH